MAKKIMLAVLALLVLMGTANAAVMVTKVSPGVDGNFLRSSTSVSFAIEDDNAGAQSMEYKATIYYGAAQGAQTTAIVSDVNLGNVMETSSVCSGTIGLTAIGCNYAWTISSVSDANYWVDVNVTAYFDWNTTHEFSLDGNHMYDQNMDSNVSFYIDNTKPVCKVDPKTGNTFNWKITEEEASEAQGSATTLYYSVVKQRKSESYSSTTGTFGGAVKSHYTSGKYDYRCYATDSAGNTGDKSSKKTIEYPSLGGTVVISGEMAPVVGAASIVTDIVADPIAFVQANPIALLVILAVAFLLFGGKSSGAKKGKRRKRR